MTVYCSPGPRVGDIIGRPCPDCGHTNAAHIPSYEPRVGVSAAEALAGVGRRAECSICTLLVDIRAEVQTMVAAEVEKVFAKHDSGVVRQAMHGEEE